MFNPVGFVFLLLWTSVLGENCITYNFESDFDHLLHSDTVICKNGQPWQLGNYTSIDITGVPSGSNRFIEPKLAPTCESTFLFDLSEGTLEVNFFMKSNSFGDFLSVFVSEIIEDEEIVYEHASFSQTTPGYKEGWNVLKINLTRFFKGYISFMGEQSEDSIVIIDSFRYYAQAYEEVCQIYAIDETTTPDPEIDTTNIPSTTESNGPDNEITTTSVPEIETTTTSAPEIETTTTSAPEIETTTTSIPEIGTTIGTESVLTTNSPVDTEKCVTYNFDNNFDALFTHEHDLCKDFDVWALNDYSTNGIDTRNANGRSYVSPNEDLSCISAFPIRMSPNGVVEVNVYIEPASELDYIIILVKNVVEGSVDTVAGSYIYEPSVSSFVRGWNVLRINVMNLRSFDGYLILLGAASEGSTVLVDSFRYIPPWASADDEECQIR